MFTYDALPPTPDNFHLIPETMRELVNDRGIRECEFEAAQLVGRLAAHTIITQITVSGIGLSEKDRAAFTASFNSQLRVHYSKTEHGCTRLTDHARMLSIGFGETMETAS